MNVAVVGAGICGLAAAYELQRGGARVTVFEAEGVAAAQSAGLARIFRIAHDDPALCALALEAREGWRAWERTFSLHLLGDEGLVVVGGVERGDAMRAAGAPVQSITGAAARFPFLTYGWDGGIVDPLAGALRIRRAHAALAAGLDIRHERIDSLDALAADAILVCAGLGTQALVPELDFEMTDEPHVRLTYDTHTHAPCVISPELYGVPIGSAGRYAIGMHEQDATPAIRPLPVVDRVDCVSLHAPWLDANGDGFLALRTGRVTAFTGANLMKFGPLIGDRLARSVFDGAVHPDLVGTRASAWQSDANVRPVGRQAPYS